MDTYIPTYLSLIDGVKLVTLFGLIGLDTVLGIVNALASGSFDFKKIASYLDTSVLKLVAGYLLVGVFALAEPGLSASVWAAWATIDAKLIADITTKLKVLGGPRKNTGGQL